MASPPLRVGFLLFPKLTQLDLTGPYEVFARLPNAAVLTIWKSPGPVVSDTGLTLHATTGFDACPPLDVVCVPGGPGVAECMEDEEVLAFLRRQAAGAKWVTSVCTGALVLGAAGLLRGKKATTHWASHDFLGKLGAVPVDARVVRDGNVVTGGGVTAGIDFGLAIAAEIAGQEAAQAIQLMIEYEPEPPFRAGNPKVATAGVLETARRNGAEMRKRREELMERVAAKLQADLQPS
ncbi:class I glutamine amidotransferase-like protein [Hyaloraphidium curvatum]|nr:class I glutamine amidotransferase-like protein [Hyaloraphidium curvatum]